MLIGSFCHIIEAGREAEGAEMKSTGTEHGTDTMGKIKEQMGENKGTNKQFRVGLNGEHPIYIGHFFGNPITPGACLVEIAEELIGRPMTQIKGLKFLNTVPPTAELVYTFNPKQENQYSITIMDEKQHITYARFNATYL